MGCIEKPMLIVVVLLDKAGVPESWVRSISPFFHPGFPSGVVTGLVIGF